MLLGQWEEKELNEWEYRSNHEQISCNQNVQDYLEPHMVENQPTA